MEFLLVLGILFALFTVWMAYRFSFSNEPGRLRLTFEPADARVSIDGQPVPGSSPMLVEHLAARQSHQISLEREGYEALETSAYLLPGWTKSLNLNLNRQAGGMLRISSEPSGAAIFLDGQPNGQRTPAALEIKGLKFPLVLGLSSGGAPQWQKRLEAPPEGDLIVNADLHADVGTLDIQSSPSGAVVKIDGKSLGKTPLYTQQVPANQTVKLVLELNGFKSYENELSVAPGQNLQIYHALQKNPSR